MDESIETIVSCEKCPRLVQWRENIARTKKKAFIEDAYWGKPVPSFGPIDAKLLIVGLAPAAHGANRTGRMFTGDESGKWLYRALFRAGFCNYPTSLHREDGLELIDTRITAIVHCAPPDNKPTVQERDRCLPYFEQELELMKHCRVIVCLGLFAWQNTLKTLQKKQAKPSKRLLTFSHGAHAQVGSHHILGSYHPSQQNTFTKRLTEKMLDDVFNHAKDLLNTCMRGK